MRTTCKRKQFIYSSMLVKMLDKRRYRVMSTARWYAAQPSTTMRTALLEVADLEKLSVCA